MPESDGGGPTSRRRLLHVGLMGGAVVLLVVAALILLIRDCCGGDRLALGASAGEEVLFQAPGVEGPDPFLSFSDLAMLTGVPIETPPADVGLFGGSLSDTCDKELLIDFLLANPAKGQAWAQVQGIQFADLPSYIAGLTPTVLTQNTVVLNHGFKNGKITEFKAVLAAGTAVLVDADGIPRARCFCGNPLTPPPPLPPKVCTVIVVTAVVFDWQDPESAQVGSLKPGDPIMVLGFAQNSDGGVGAQIEMADGTIGWITAESLSDKCPCTVEEVVDVFATWDPVKAAVLGRIGPGDAVVVLGEYAVDGYSGFGVFVELEDGTRGWVAADAISASTTFQSSSDVVAKHPSTPGPVASGSAIGWAITYQAETPQPGATVVDEFGPGVTYVPGSAQGPAGWAVDDSVPGQVSWVYQGGSGPATVSTATLQSSLLPFALPSGQGDGYMPILWKDRLYLTSHHSLSTAGSFRCFDLADPAQGPCQGFPKPLPDGDSASAQTVPVGYAPENVVVVHDQLLYPATRLGSTPVDWGLACYDLATDAECGFARLGVNGVTGPQLAGDSLEQGVVQGPWVIDGRAYVFDATLRIHCVDVSQPSFAGNVAGNVCNSNAFPFDASPLFAPQSPGSAFEVKTSGAPGLYGQADGTRLYVGTSYVDKADPPPSSRLLCFDTVTKASCQGWPGTVSMDASWLQLVRDSALTTTHVCNTAGVCVLTSDGSPAAAPLLDLARDSAYAVVEVAVGTRTFVPRNRPDPALDTVACVDWIAQSLCAGWGPAGDGTVTAIYDNDGLYGLGHDPETDCIYATGDKNRVWSFDAATGLLCAGDGAFGATGGLAPTPVFACQTGGVGWVWDTFKATGVDPAEWESLQATLFGGGKVVATINLLAAPTTDLSYLGASPASLTYSVVGIPKPGARPSVAVSLSTRSDGKPLEFCVQTIVESVSCQPIVQVLDGARVYPFGPGGEPISVSAVAGVKVYPTPPASGCDACAAAPDESTPVTTAATTTSLGTITTSMPTTTTIATTTTAERSTDPDPEAEYCVIDIASDDVLNIRSGAGTDFEIIGEFAHDATGIRLTGERAEDGDGRVWYEVLLDRDPGWVASWFLSACG